MSIMEKKEILSSVDILNAGCHTSSLMIRHFDRIFDCFFKDLKNSLDIDSLTYREDLLETERMREIAGIIFGNFSSSKITCEQIRSLTQKWSFNAYEFMEIFISTQKKSIAVLMPDNRLDVGMVDRLVPVLESLCENDKSLFLEKISEYNKLPAISVEASKENIEDLLREKEEENAYSHLRKQKKEFSYKEIFEKEMCKNFHKDIPLDLWLNIQLNAQPYELDYNHAIFERRDYFQMLKEINLEKRNYIRNNAATSTR